jgi:hypothetical protein
MFDKPMSQRKFAELVGVDAAVVSSLIKAGTLAKGEPAGVWIKAYCVRLREASAGRAGPLQEERAKLARAQRLKLEREAKRDSGEFIRTASALAQFTSAIRAFRDAALAIPGRICFDLAAVGGDAAAIERALTKEIRSELTRVASMARAPANPEPAAIAEKSE